MCCVPYLVAVPPSLQKDLALGAFRATRQAIRASGVVAASSMGPPRPFPLAFPREAH